MQVNPLVNANASVITVTNTATALKSLLDTAAGQANTFRDGLDAVDLVVEDGDIRVLYDNNTPTASKGILLQQGTMLFIRHIPINSIKLIRAGASDVAVGIQVGRSEADETTSGGGSSGGGGGSSSITSVVPGTGATNLGKAEDAVHASGDTGVMALGVRKDTAASLAGTDGDYTAPIFGASGHQHVAEGFAAQAEDNTNAVIATANKPLTVNTYTWSVDFSSALEASSVIKASAGTLRSIFGRIDSTHATATYYFQVLNAASVPADGAVTHLIAPRKIAHVNGTNTNFEIDLTDSCIHGSTGLVWCLSTTEFTKTISGAFVSATALYK